MPGNGYGNQKAFKGKWFTKTGCWGDWKLLRWDSQELTTILDIIIEKRKQMTIFMSFRQAN
jgi:hypothetical protein